jgi:hypothetical protein
VNDMRDWRKLVKRTILAVLVLLLLGGGALAAFVTTRGPEGRNAAVAANMIGCVYSSPETGHRFLRSIQPGESVRIGKTDELVLLPTTDQIYNMTSGSNQTELAPAHVLAFTKGQTAVWVEGVLKFRLNTAGDKACKFYSRYGSGSYGALGMVVRETGVQQRTGWYRFLAETHGDIMKQVVHDGSSAWTWQQLAYGSDPTVSAPVSVNGEPISVTYGRQIGALFTKYLGLNLGDQYFCGVQPGLSGAGATPGCPPMYFQILSVYPRDKSLADEHDALKRLDAELARQRQAAKLKAQNRATAIESAKAQRKVLDAQIVNTRLAAQNDLKIQKCLILAKIGLDCDGHKPTIVVSGVSTSGK